MVQFIYFAAFPIHSTGKALRMELSILEQQLVGLDVPSAMAKFREQTISPQLSSLKEHGKVKSRLSQRARIFDSPHPKRWALIGTFSISVLDLWPTIFLFTTRYWSILVFSLLASISSVYVYLILNIVSPVYIKLINSFIFKLDSCLIVADTFPC